MKSVLVIGDPLDQLNPSSDTTLILVEELIQRSIDISYATENDIFFAGSKIFVRSTKVKNQTRFALPELADATAQPKAIESFSHLIIRKNPPFDSSYLRLCWMLVSYESKIKMLNPASSLLRYHEKMLPLDAVTKGFLDEDDMIPTCVTTSLKDVVHFAENLKTQKMISKPFLGFGGNDIQLLDRSAFLKNPVLEPDRMIQPFMETIQLGDRRSFFFYGKYYGSFVRLPKEGGFIANLAKGGQAIQKELSKVEESLIAKIENYLQSTSIVFAGSDFIGGKLSEINITSPTGFASYEKLFQRNLAKELMALFLKDEAKK